MTPYIFVSPSGRISGYGQCQAENLASVLPPEGCSVIPYLQGLPEEGVYFDAASGKVIDARPKPSPHHVFDYTIKQWVFDSDLAATTLRTQRDRLLADSDWTQLPDAPLATKEVWATYRQALRDITSQSGFPTEVTWPQRPQLFAA